MSNKLLVGKKGLLVGITNERSLGWGIAKMAKNQGAQIAMTYQNETIKRKVEPLAKSIGASSLLYCDVKDSESVDNLFTGVKETFGTIDFLIHAVAFSDKNELKGPYFKLSRSNFLNAMEISCYSFTLLARKAAELMTNGGSLLTLSYYGAEKVIPNYNVMGLCKAALEASVKYLAVDLGGRNIRVNAISAGPVKTLSAAGISDFSHILQWYKENSPLRRNITLEDVGNSAAFLLSELSSSITGEVMHLDAGYHAVGMKMVDYDENDNVIKN